MLLFQVGLGYPRLHVTLRNEYLDCEVQKNLHGPLGSPLAPSTG